MAPTYLADVKATVAALAVLAAALAAIAAAVIHAAGLGTVVYDNQPALMHAQAMDVLIGVGAALGCLVMLATIAVITTRN